MLNAEENSRRLTGIKVGRGTPTITHLLYADDILITCKAQVADAMAIKIVLDDFGEWSGLKANSDKSSIFSSPNTDRRIKSQIKGIMGFREMKK